MKTTSSPVTWHEDIRRWWNNFLTQFNLKSVDIMQIILYAGVAFIVGFFTKRYFRSLFIGILLTALILGFLHYTQVITLNMARLNAMAGVPLDRSLEFYSTLLINWVKQNTVLAISSILGFIAGYKTA